MSLSITVLVEPLGATVATREHRARLLIGYRRLLAACRVFGESLIKSLLLPEGTEEFERACGLLRIGRLTPRYTREGRSLSWGRHLVKCFKQPAGNQELILSAAEDFRWEPWFDDPLPVKKTIDPKVREHDAIKCLNRHQRLSLVHFKGDGTGTRIGWELR